MNLSDGAGVSVFRTSRQLVSTGVLICVVCSGQNSTTVDWAKKAFSRSCPAEASPRSGGLSIVVENLNTVIYTYNISATADPTVSDDFANAASFFKGESGTPITIPTGVEACTDLYNTLADSLSLVSTAFSALEPKTTASGPVDSIPLATTVAAWATLKASDAYKALVAAKNFISSHSPPCNAPTAAQAKNLADAKKLLDALNKFDQAVNSAEHNRSISLGLTPGADNHVTIHIVELYNGKPTASPDPNLTCDIKSSVLTLSGGLLVSTIPARDYVSVKTPGTPANGQTSQNVLAVQDASNIHPAGLFLLNYDLPWFAGDSYGFALSSGPTIRINGPTNTSNFGYFVGGSIHFWKRLFITVGGQIGEFADYPAGFTNGTVIPDNFGALVPVKRWTIKPGFAITYQTKSFSTSGTSNQANSTAPKAPSTASGTPVTKAKTNNPTQPAVVPSKPVVNSTTSQP